MDRARSLRGAGSFRRVIREGVKARSDGVTVHARRGGSGAPRVGLSVKGARTAVQRNVVKRRLRSSLRSHDLPEGLELVVRADPSVAEGRYQELEAALKEALTRAKAIA